MGILARLRQIGEDPRVVLRALGRRYLNALRAARQIGEDPRVVLRALGRRNLNALRTALAQQTADFSVDIEQIVFDDALESHLVPTDQASVARRLYHNRLGLNLAARVESKIGWRLLAASLAGLAGVWSIATLTEGHAATPAETLTLVGAGLLAIAAGGWLAWRSLGMTPESHAMLLPGGAVIEQVDLDDAREFARRALLRELPAGTPADLADRFRPLTVDASGRPVDGQVIAQDLVESYALEASNDRLIVLGAASLALILTGFGSLTSASAGNGLESMVGGLIFSLPAGILAGIGVVYSVSKLFLLPDVAERRALAGHEARQASPLAKLVEESGEASFAQIEAARAKQAELAGKDQSPFIQLGDSTGLLAERRCPFAPSEVAMAVGLSVADLSTHLIVFGDTGTGKTSGVLRPVIAAWAQADAGGLVVLDGKGVLPAEVADLPDFQIISPDRAAFNPIENLTPDEVADGFVAMFASKDSADPFWDRASAKLIRAGATVLQLAAAVDPAEVRFNLGSLYRLLFAKDGLAEARAVLFENPAAGESLELLPSHIKRAWDYLSVEFPALPEKTRGSISGNASLWLSAFVDHALLSAWAEADEGVQIEDALDGARIGVLLPEAEFGQAGAAVANFAKQRLYRALKMRGDTWKAEGGKPVMLVVDECQALVTRDETAMLPIARSLGLHAVFSTQNVDGIVAALGGSSKQAEAEQLLGQFKSLVSLSVSTPATREFVSTRMGTASRARYSQVSAAANDAAGTVLALRHSASGHAAGTSVGDALVSSGRIHGLRRITGLGGHLPAMLDEAAKKVGMGGLLEAIPGLVRDKQPAASFSIGVSALVSAEEVALLTAEPDTALVSVMRGRVPRRDLVKLNPIYSFS